ncbi:FadR/GntR family transcriptional regulator [Actinomadura scrupuli]|uniref:FadR/GntR family transcriptional regulator n=1 Tax=Actinomadura scrupuli TaxID=559629 RepID=UPI003D994A1C
MPEQMRQPRLAELVASRLREEILSGRLKEGDSLPRQEDLLADFRVSLPSVREAMRILETEGLISVRRGNVGGAQVHLPTVRRTAYMLSLVLQARQVALTDTGTALGRLEPICAGMCAARPDRETAVLPVLRAMLDEQQQAIGDAAAFNRSSREFHERLVELCGNETMILVVGAMESIWSAHEAETFQHVRPGTAPDADTMRAAFRDHRALLRAIESGNEPRAASLARAHLEATQAYTLGHDQGLTAVVAELVKGGGPASPPLRGTAGARPPADATR